MIYQIYPRSFQDSNGDGIGDIQGIISRLDYLKDLGVDIIWLCPVYDSPNDDNGYDIRNYYEIHPEFGTMQDFDALLEGLHSRGMRLIMDLVVNHSSDEHEWFEESRKSKDNPYRDYYFWRPGKNGGPPNNWGSIFGGSAWQHDPLTDEYYLHLFTKKQPDLNWENPKVREGVKDILKFWLDKGIDGFRMDVITCISKDISFPDTTLDDFNSVIEQVYANGPKVHEYINEMYESVIKNYDVMTVGEGPGISPEISLDYIGADRGELNMIFHLEHMFLGHGALGKFDPVPFSWEDVKNLFRKWDKAMGEEGWISVFLDNHDFPRMVSRFGNDGQYRVESSKLLAMMVLTLMGTPSIYFGSEIGMTNVQFETLDDYRDVEVFNVHKEHLERGATTEEFVKLVHLNGRDNVRTPMQWDASNNSGFSQGLPWIKVNPNYESINVEADLKKPDSIYMFYKELLAYRKRFKTFAYGSWNEIRGLSENLFIYTREDEEHFLIALNHSEVHEAIEIDTNGYALEIQNLENDMSSILLPWEARLYRKAN